MYLYGLGELGHANPAWTSIQQDLNVKLAAYGQARIRVMGVSNAPAWNALTWLLGPEWSTETSGTRVRVRVRNAKTPVMADVPWWEDVRDVQIPLGLGNDGKLGPITWNAISAEYARASGAGFEWWRQPFATTKAVLLGRGVAPQRPVAPVPVVSIIPKTAAEPITVVAPGPTVAPTPVSAPTSPTAVVTTAPTPPVTSLVARPQPGMPPMRPGTPTQEIVPQRAATVTPAVTKTPGARAPVVVVEDDGTLSTVEDEGEVTEAKTPWGLLALAGGLLWFLLGRKKKRKARRNPRRRR